MTRVGMSRTAAQQTESKLLLSETRQSGVCRLSKVFSSFLSSFVMNCDFLDLENYLLN